MQTTSFGRTTLDKKQFTLGAIILHVLPWWFDMCPGIALGTCWYVLELWPLQVEWEMLALSLTRQCLVETSAGEKSIIGEAALHSNVKGHNA